MLSVIQNRTDLVRAYTNTNDIRIRELAGYTRVRPADADISGVPRVVSGCNGNRMRGTHVSGLEI